MEDLKAGLEIHQQLDTSKLFCSCPSLLRNDSSLFKVKRQLNPVIGETGEIDSAVEHEKKKDKNFIYEFYDTNCLVELDEEPPHNLNCESLKICLQIALLFNCKIFPVSQVMRKTVIDGSNTGGFQRSVLIAYDGYFDTSQGRVGIETIALEEDAARIISKEDNVVVYRLDRLGIPLVEITTKPDLKSPEQVKEAALKIGEILRSCNVKRGIGTIRQDLNISINNGNRVEIKGFQDPKMMIQTVNLEIQRQKVLGELYNVLKKKSVLSNEPKEISTIFKNTSCKMIKNVLNTDNKGKVYALKVPEFNGFFGKELYPGKRFGSEVSDYAKMYGVGGIIHSDEKLEKYNFGENEIIELKRFLELGDLDAFVIVLGEEIKVRNALEAVVKRINMQLKESVPKEVRKSNEDGSTSFLRPMPGSARMYPETDVELLKISKDLINETKKNLPKLKGELTGYLKEYGLNDEMIKLVLEENKLNDFKNLIQVYNNPSLVAKMLTLFKKEIAVKHEKTEEEIEDLINIDLLESILSNVGKKISENDVKIVMQRIVEGKSLKDAMQKSDVDLSGEIKKLIKEKPNLSVNGYMGLVMAKFKGQVSGKEVMDEIKNLGIGNS